MISQMTLDVIRQLKDRGLEIFHRDYIDVNTFTPYTRFWIDGMEKPVVISTDRFYDANAIFGPSGILEIFIDALQLDRTQL